MTEPLLPANLAIKEIPGSQWIVGEPMDLSRANLEAEALWLGSLIAHLGGLQLIYIKLQDERQRYRAIKAVELVGRIARKAYPKDEALAIAQAAWRVAHKAVANWPEDKDPSPIETAWWAQAASCAFVLSSTYGLYPGATEELAVLASDAFRLIRAGVECAFPSSVARALIEAATAVEVVPPAEKAAS